MNRWTKLYKRIVPGMPWRREAWRRRPKDQKLLTLTPSTWLSMPSGWLSLSKKKKRNSPHYPQMVTVFSVLPSRWTAQTRTLMVRIVYAMMVVSLCSLTKTQWRHGLSTMPGWLMSHFIGQAASFGFGFVLGRGTTDTIFVVRQLQEKNIVAKKLFYVYLCRLWENIWPCAKEGSMVGLKGPQGQGMGGMCHPGHVLHCPESCVQWWVWHGSWCAWGLCP